MKFSAKKSIFLNFPSGSPFGIVLWGNLEKSIFWPRISLKNLKMTKLSQVGHFFIFLHFFILIDLRSDQNF